MPPLHNPPHPNPPLPTPTLPTPFPTPPFPTPPFPTPPLPTPSFLTPPFPTPPHVSVIRNVSSPAFAYNCLLFFLAADATGQSSESAMSSCPVSNVMDRRSASPVSECQTKMSLNAQGIASTSAVDEGSLVANISTTDPLPNGNLGDDR